MATQLAFALGGQEMLLVFLIVLLLFGAKKLPELAKGLGKSAGEFKKAKEDFDRELKGAADDAERDWDRDVVDPKEAPSKVAAAGSDEKKEEKNA
ncbi:MAG: sec-independent protein translocase protein TatA [Verrucomicrobiales bacterium]|jgi:sec-independent protein translocase protein TatA